MNAQKIFLKHAKFVCEVDATGFNINYLKKLFEYTDLKVTANYNPVKEEFYYLRYVTKTNHFPMHEYELDFPKIPDKIKDILFPTNDIFNVLHEEVSITPDNLKKTEELEIKKSYILVEGRKHLLQEINFFCDRRNFVKESFVTELNKFISIYGSISYFEIKK